MGLSGHITGTSNRLTGSILKIFMSIIITFLLIYILQGSTAKTHLQAQLPIP